MGDSILTLSCWLITAGALVHAETDAISHLLPPTALLCSGFAEPLAVADAHPEFGWQLAAALPALHGVAQSAYRIQVAEGSFATEKDIQWDSGMVKSASTFDVAYAGPALSPGRSFAWRVEVWDEDYHTSGWSVVAHWTQAPEWHAPWIAAHPLEEQPAQEPMPLFRKNFNVAHPVARAVLYASGLGQDELRINGQKVGNDELTPGWSNYRKTVYYDTYDVTAMLHSGANAVGVMLGNGMFNVVKEPDRYTKFVGSFGEPRCAIQLELTFTDGSTEQILSDGTWKTAPGPITVSHVYGGEDYDARLEQKGWDEASFNDAAWQAASIVEATG